MPGSFFYFLVSVNKKAATNAAAFLRYEGGRYSTTSLRVKVFVPAITFTRYMPLA